MTPGVGPMSLGRGQFGCRHSPGLFLTNTQPSLAPRQNLFSSVNTTVLYVVLHMSSHAPVTTPLCHGLATTALELEGLFVELLKLESTFVEPYSTHTFL
ncbi:hypothetical protein TNCV_1130911 [Trichonephila clavipes]|nr:hypothetical protein TNCV_1130911 [Trichonephila clavipes]